MPSRGWPMCRRISSKLKIWVTVGESALLSNHAGQGRTYGQCREGSRTGPLSPLPIVRVTVAQPNEKVHVILLKDIFDGLRRLQLHSQQILFLENKKCARFNVTSGISHTHFRCPGRIQTTQIILLVKQIQIRTSLL